MRIKKGDNVQVLSGNDKVRGNFPIGVSWHKASNKYSASVNEFNKQKHWEILWGFVK